MDKKPQPSALKAYQDFAKQYKADYLEKHGVKAPEIHIKDAYQLRKKHNDYDSFKKEHVIPEKLKDEELLKLKEDKKVKKEVKLARKLAKAEKKEPEIKV